MKGILVADVMTRNPLTIGINATLLECAKKMVKNKVGSLLVVEHKKLIGIISHSDILWALVKKSKEDLARIKAIDISPRKIATIRPDVTIERAIEKMKKVRFKKLPVLHEKNLVGLVTIKDILNFSPELYPELEEFSRIREETKKLQRIKEAEKTYDGMCEECGSLSTLRRFNGVLLCESCIDSHQ